jgi:DNA topoisomerase-2
VNGVWKKIDRTTIQITELPIKKWIGDYKNMLEEMIMEGDLVEEFSENHKDNTVDFKIKLKDDVDQIEKMPGGVKKKFKLSTTISANNYVLFDKFRKIKKYENEVQILEEFYTERFDLYQKRKDYLIRVLKKEVA